MKETGRKSGRSFLCKVRIERRIRSSPSAVPPSAVPPCTFSRPAEVSLGVFHSATSTFAHRFLNGSALLLAARVKGGRGSRSEFSKPRIKRRIELHEGRGTAEEDEGEEEAAEDRERK